MEVDVCKCDDRILGELDARAETRSVVCQAGNREQSRESEVCFKCERACPRTSSGACLRSRAESTRRCAANTNELRRVVDNIGTLSYDYASCSPFS